MSHNSLITPLVELLQQRSGDDGLSAEAVAEAFESSVRRSPEPGDSGLVSWLYRPVLATVHHVLGAHRSPHVRALANQGQSTAFTDEAIIETCEQMLEQIASESEPPLGDVLRELELSGRTLTASAVALQIAPGKLRVWHRRARSHAIASVQSVAQRDGRSAT